jgi:hypothetical protein
MDKGRAGKVPDLNDRNGQQQTVPTEDTIEDHPPPYEASHPSAPSTADDGPSTTAPSAAAPPTPTHSSHSSIDAHDRSGLLSSFRGPGAFSHLVHGQGQGREVAHANEHMSATNRSSVHSAPSSAGYKPSNPMSATGAQGDDAKWADLEGTPGCCFSESGGCCGSSHGGCCFSDRGGCCFSDNAGCCFSDHAGCCFSDHEGCCFSDTKGCCFSSNGAGCCSAGPLRR